jgi:hypothetical protein
VSGTRVEIHPANPDTFFDHGMPFLQSSMKSFV